MRADVEIYLLRHGETVWNREGRFQGRRDSPLTLRGMQQALAAGRFLRARLGSALAHFQLIASPQPRAWQSAVLLAEAAGLDVLAIRLDPAVVEMSWGRWDGLTAAEIAARDPELWQRRIDDGLAEAPPNGGESRAAVWRRAQAWYTSLPPQSRIVLVSHGTFGRALRCVHADLSHDAMLGMRFPHDRAFHLHAGGVEELPLPPMQPAAPA